MPVHVGYLPQVATGVTTRLLAREKLPTLLPAVDAFVQQSKAKVEVRSAPNFHDRYLIVDRVACYQSGASFKDGAKSAPTTLTQITDAFAAVLVILRRSLISWSRRASLKRREPASRQSEQRRCRTLRMQIRPKSRV